MLEMQQICVRSPEKRILRDVSFAIREGESLAIVGETGSGKSTLLKLLLGLPLGDLVMEHGAIRWGEQLVPSGKKQSPSSIVGSELAWVSQQAGRFFYDRRTIQRHYKDLARNLARKGQEARPLAECLEMVGLSEAEIASRYPFELSGGMMQRVAIGLALVSSPRLLLADEPTSALDVVHKEEIVALLKELQQVEKMSLLLVTHDLSVARRLAEKTLVLRAGEVVEYGKTLQVLESPQSDYTRLLLASIPQLKRGE